MTNNKKTIVVTKLTVLILYKKGTKNKNSTSYKISNKHTKKIFIFSFIVNLDVFKKPHSKNSVLYI